MKPIGVRRQSKWQDVLITVFGVFLLIEGVFLIYGGWGPAGTIGLSSCRSVLWTYLLASFSSFSAYTAYCQSESKDS